VPNTSNSKRPSLTHPVFSSDIEANKQQQQSRPVPAFPEIGTQMEGTYLEVIRGLGVRRDLQDIIFGIFPTDFFDIEGENSDTLDFLDDDIEAQYQLLFSNYAKAFLHEGIGHKFLDTTLIVKVTRLNALKMWMAIEALCVGEEYASIDDIKIGSELGSTRTVSKSVLVPLSPESSFSGSTLQRIWHILSVLNEKSGIVQEVFSIWYSLRKAKEMGQWPIKRDEFQKIDRYDNYFHGLGFRDLYIRFRDIAGKVGYNTVIAMVRNALKTFEPREELESVLKKYENYFLYISHGMDRNEAARAAASAENNKDLRMRAADYKQYCRSDEVRYLLSNPTPSTPVERLLFDPALSFWFSYDDKGVYFNNMDKVEEVGILFVFLESLRQQMTCGIGVKCPFWSEDEAACCTFRPLLEGFWKNTAHKEGVCESWRRQGCLELYAWRSR
jgi:hypothetical protein